MTGAVVPDGADAVVPVEDTESSNVDRVTILRVRSAGDYVRERGTDVRAGTVLVPGGTLIASRHIGALAAAGVAEVSVRALPRVAVITTGAELVDASATPTLGQIFDSNLAAVTAAVTAAGGTVASAQRVTDDVDAMLTALAIAAEADVIVTSGGVSMGDYEVVREALEPLGAHVGHVAMQPGGPQAIAVFDGTPVLCFPGNPVSTQISFEVFLAPLLREAAGLAPASRQWHRLAQLLDSVPGKRQFLRGRRLDGGRVELVAGPGSHLVAGLAASDVLIDIPEDVTELQEGDAVECWVL
jgi:molybdopterin molybdotransferase